MDRVSGHPPARQEPDGSKGGTTAELPARRAVGGPTEASG